MSFFSDFLNLFYPALCTSCGERLIANESYLCLNCLSNLPKTDYHNIPDNKLEQLFAGRFSFVRISSFAYFTKGGVVQPLIHQLKYNNKPQLGIYIGQLCGEEIKGSLFLENVDYIVPVPLHPKRLKQRGYNQALKIVEGMCSVIPIEVSSNNLVRIVNNISQTKQQKDTRQLNTDSIFDIKHPELFEGKHILIVDDILTTGSTIESCVKAISKKATNCKISVFTVGFAVLQ